MYVQDIHTHTDTDTHTHTHAHTHTYHTPIPVAPVGIRGVVDEAGLAEEFLKVSVLGYISQRFSTIPFWPQFRCIEESTLREHASKWALHTPPKKKNCRQYF